MVNYRLLMCICSNASVVHGIAMMHSMCVLKLLPYIYGGEYSKFMKLPMNSSSIAQSFFPLL